MSIFSKESELLVKNWKAVVDITKAKQNLARELVNYLYSFKNDLINTNWWQNEWDFNKDSLSGIYVSKHDWLVNNDYAIWIGVETFNADSLFGDESSAQLYVWVSKIPNNFQELVVLLRDIIKEKEKEYVGELHPKISQPFIVTQQVQQFLPEELNDFEITVKAQVLKFIEYYAILLTHYDEQIKSLL